MRESQYSPVRTDAEGIPRVQLADDHPGVRDLSYRARRDALAALALAWRPGAPVPTPSYEDTEHQVWQAVSRKLAGLHERHASEWFLAGKEAVELPADRVPQLEEVTARLRAAHRHADDRDLGFVYRPVAGLAPLRQFYADFSEGIFWSTQYLRHPSRPLYTPEPDLIHEVIGHANQLGHPSFARLYRQFGRAVRRTESGEALRLLSKVFWFTMEFGVVWESGRLKAFGAGILSSVGETERFSQARIRPADLAEMGHIDYDITHLQPVLYAWESLTELEERLGHFLDTFSDRERACRRTRRGYAFPQSL